MTERKVWLIIALAVAAAFSVLTLTLMFNLWGDFGLFEIVTIVVGVTLASVIIFAMEDTESEKLSK